MGGHEPEGRHMSYEWPETKAEYDSRMATARRRYGPIVAKLPPWEVHALSEVVGERMQELSVEARSEDISRGARPAGTRIGR